MKSQKQSQTVFILFLMIALMAFDIQSDTAINESMLPDSSHSFTDHHINSKCGSEKFTAINNPLYPTEVSINNVAIKIVATGNTSGHIADAHIQNKSRKRTTARIPAGEIPIQTTSGSQAHQGFYVPDPMDVEVPGNSNLIVPIRGFCNDPTLDPPTPGTTLPDPSNWSTPTDDIQTIRKISKSTEKLQNEGLINTPFSANPTRERESVIQQTVWWYTISDHDPCRSIRELLTGDPAGTGSDYEDQGISQIMDAIRRVGRASGIPSFTPPALPMEAGEVQGPIPSNRAGMEKEITIKVVGTGRTTGHIAELFVTNPNDHPVVMRVGTGDMARSSGFYIPASGQHQPYIVPSISDISVGPKETVKVPVEGYCVDIRRPPVAEGDPMASPSDWIGLPSDPPAILQTPDGTTIIHVPTRTALPVDEAKDILLGKNTPPPPTGIRPWMPNAFKTGLDCPDVITNSYPTFPGTDNPIVHVINTDEKLGVLVPMLLESIDLIIEVTDAMQSNGQMRTPFSSRPAEEREAVIQQTFWMFTSAVSGDDYPKKEFESNTYEQFETATGQPINNLPPAQKTEIDRGIDNFWNTFQAVGAEAKILTKPIQMVVPQTAANNPWQSYGKIAGLADRLGERIRDQISPDRSPKVQEKREPDNVPKMVSDTSIPAPGTADSASKDDKPEGDEEETNDEPCKCDNMTFDLVIRRVNAKDNTREVRLLDEAIVIKDAGNTKKMDIDVIDWKQGDYYSISLMRGNMNCACTNAGSAESIDCEFYSRSKNVSQKDKLRITKDPSKRNDVESLDSEKGDRTNFRFSFSPAEPKSNVIEFCFSAYCFSKDCNLSNNGVRCRDYCLELTFKEVK